MTDAPANPEDDQPLVEIQCLGTEVATDAETETLTATVLYRMVVAAAEAYTPEVDGKSMDFALARHLETCASDFLRKRIRNAS